MDIDSSLEKNKVDAYALYKENCLEALRMKRLQYLLDLVDDELLGTLLSMLDTIKRAVTLGETYFSAEVFMSNDSKLYLSRVITCLNQYREIFRLLGYHVDYLDSGKYSITVHIHPR